MDESKKIKKVDNVMTAASVGTVLLGIINILMLFALKGVFLVDPTFSGSGLASNLGVIMFGILMGVTGISTAVLAVIYPIDHKYTQTPWHAGFFAMEACIITACLLSFIAVYKCMVGLPPLWIPIGHVGLFVMGMAAISLSLEGMDKPEEV